jgi:hypothetical protein
MAGIVKIIPSIAGTLEGSAPAETGGGGATGGSAGCTTGRTNWYHAGVEPLHPLLKH